MDPSNHETLACHVCGEPIELTEDEDGVITLPDAEDFRRVHSGCLLQAEMQNRP